MLEILILVALTNRIGKIVEAKGYKSAKYKWSTVGLWFGGEIVGAFIGALLTNGDSDATCLLYIIALIGAAIGAAIANSIATKLEPLPGYPKAPELAGQTNNSSQKLQELKKMLDDGLINAEEYETKKADILSKM